MKQLFLLISIIVQYGVLSGQRIEHTINSAWQFSLHQHPESTGIVHLPHTWNAEDAFKGEAGYFRGKGSYHKQLLVPAEWSNRRVYIKFEGANQVAKLWMNDHFVGEHKGGYTGFSFDLTSHVSFGEINQLKVEVDNSHNADIPPLEADFNFYGGIYRDVSIISTSALHFEVQNEAAGRFMISTPTVSEQEADVAIEAVVVNETGSTKKAEVIVKLVQPNGAVLRTLKQNIKLKPGEKRPVKFETEINKPTLWSPESPALYKAELSIADKKDNSMTDAVSSTFGCRWFSIDPVNGFFLNGKHYKLIGVNRHQDYEGLGNALPKAIHQKDYRLIKEMGCNFVRIAHYPHDPEAYRLCDELGLLVWSEIPIINEITNSEAFTQNCLQMQREHISQFYNHPSVIMWGYMNEIFLRMVFTRGLTEEKKQEIILSSKRLAQQLDSLSRDLDTDRMTVMALHNNPIYNTTGIADIPDVIGWNLYFGWYDDQLHDLGAFLDQQHRLYPNRPIMISEYGPGADIRIQTDTPLPWDYSEAYQLKSHRSYYKQVMERPYMLGMAAWNFADFGSSGRQDARPFVNQKGLLNFDRSPKNVYHYYQALLLDKPFVFIANKNRELRYAVDLDSVTGLVVLDVFSNQAEVKLWVNDTLYLTSGVDNGIARFNLSLPEGQYRLKAEAGGAIHHGELQLALRSKLLHQISERPLCVNVGSHCDYTDPISDEVWVHDQAYRPGGWGYVGGQVFQRNNDKFQGTPINIKGTDNDPLFQTMREGIEQYRFDLADGLYRVTLLFVEPNSWASTVIYNLSDEEDIDDPALRVFDIKANGIKVLPNINLAQNYGSGRGVKISFEAKAKDGLVVEFNKVKGRPVLSGIQLESLMR
ncbi:beta-galactosidase [Saccharicrinis carchari]|uniref:Beta-galactosidase n=1 Tax=Saccharicrinis carchari TaxID=1168039 RepID=A0A521C6J3_SACCC|nr:glycoside hydrolase family 2 TIM barrel-domain containing protein [Saccharicrinis carchari]SMO54300.1 beta-galactosidase [Saccharicrinis carchari]